MSAPGLVQLWICRLKQRPMPDGVEIHATAARRLPPGCNCPPLHGTMRPEIILPPPLQRPQYADLF